ncbi:MAG TPA: hypothetical protein PLU71_04225 [Candidatus Dependentiae bacterium]|nr:hypothetical protein [Candidatus Dependentiae bacterium]HRQ63039.1 hypothetical protein [Candidatus Dependentiae bacterium]
MKSKALLALVCTSISLFIHTQSADESTKIRSSDVTVIFKQLNNPNFGTDVLPHNFSYLTNLLEFGKNTHKGRTYIERVLRVFNRLIKGTPYINAYAFSDMLEVLPGLLEQDFIAHKSKAFLKNSSLLDLDMYDRFKESVNNVLYHNFLSDYDEFKKDPDDFLAGLTTQIIDIVEEEVNIDQLRHVLLRFLELGTSKLVWSPEDQEYVWTSVKKISNQLAKLVEYNVLQDLDDLDDMYWSLIHRFCFFVDMTHTSLDVEFYDAIQHDLTRGELTLVELEEQESWLESKEDCLTRTIKASKAKKLAYDQGIIART